MKSADFIVVWHWLKEAVGTELGMVISQLHNECGEKCIFFIVL